VTTRVVATAGHVDHGKSTLVRALTGVDPDRFEEERRRGLTIDLGFARWASPTGIDVDLVDVPGHVRFLKNMLAGVGAVDACLFVVAASEGWKPQSEEHLRVLELLGMRQGVVALTKADGVDPDTLELARLEVEERTKGTFLDGAPVVAVAAPAGIGLDELSGALDAVVQELPDRADRGRPRLWVDRSFAISGAGTVVTGTLAHGGLAVGDVVEVVTGGGARPARVRRLEAFGTAVEALPPGCRAAVNHHGVTRHEVGRGDAVVTPGGWHRTSVVDATLVVLASSPRPVRGTTTALVHLGSGEHTARLRPLGTAPLAPGGAGLVRLTLPTPLPLVPGDRYVVRDRGSAATIGGGEVLDVAPVLRPSLARPDRSVDRVVRERGWVDVDELERLTGVRVRADLGSWAVDPSHLAATRDGLGARVAAAGPAGLDLASVDVLGRAILEADEQFVVRAGRATSPDVADHFATHPYLAALGADLFSPPPPDGLATAEDVRELVRRGLAVKEGDLVFHAHAVEQTGRVAAELLAASPGGFSVGQLRERLGTSRRFAVPLLALLDRGGITRRRGDVRVGGPRLPRRSA
jgi:selenocysteine-specific elongation factor